MKRPAWVKQSGPFKCLSYVSGYILVKPSWEQFGPVWKAGEGGGPGIFSRMALAEDMEKWLNSIYTPEAVTHAHERIAEHDKNLEEREKAYKKRQKVHKPSAQQA